MNTKLVFTAVFLLMSVGGIGAQSPEALAEKVQKWQDERVMILKSSGQETIFADCEDRRHTEREPSYANFGGKTGVITKASLRQNAPGGKIQLTITMDGSNEKLILCNDRPLGFFSEFEIAKSLEGKSLWTKGIRLLRDAQGKNVVIPNTGKLTVTRVEWGNYATPILVSFKAESGQEGTLETNFITQGYGTGFNERYHLSLSWNGYPYMEQFYPEDPHKAHPDWSKAIWGIIEQGTVAIGMNLQMAEAACGGRFALEGAVISDSGETGQILRCEYSLNFFKKFVVQNGKVTRYSEQQGP